jgi:alcohol dehydrogenase class IV
MRFEFATASRILFGAGALSEVGSAASGMGSCALLVTTSIGEGEATLLDSLTEQGMPLLDWLGEYGITVATFTVDREPTVYLVQEGVDRAIEAGCDLVIAIGGGSAVDTGKAISAVLANGGTPLDYLEVIGKGKPITKRSVPFIAIPTTAGTGAEVTRNAVLLSPEHNVKVSLRSPLMLPHLALVDPVLTHTAPPAVTASTGMDALTQVIEPYVSNKANPMMDALCREGMKRAARSLQRAYAQGDDPAAREDMAIASLFGGLALANAALGAVHGFAGPLGGMFHAPHGAVCACLLPHVVAVNVRVLKECQPDSEALQRYGEIARILTGDPGAAIDDGVAWIGELGEALQIPPLSTYGITPQDFPVIIEKSSVASSMKGNPIKLTVEDMEEVLNRALH